MSRTNNRYYKCKILITIYFVLKLTYNVHFILFSQFNQIKLDHFDFYVPESDTIDIFAEITSATGFEYDNLFIRYNIDLPLGKIMNLLFN